MAHILTPMVKKKSQAKNPGQIACDGNFAGSIMCDLIDIKAVELLPEIKAVFDTGCVDLTVAGNFAAVSRDINAGTGVINDDRYSLPDIYDKVHQIIKAPSKN